MTPCSKIRREILILAANDVDEIKGMPLDTDDQVYAAYAKLQELGVHWDYESEYRGGQCVTDVSPDWNRNYESKSVARKMPDGSWVGWTYFYGGGKHGDPDAVPWMEYAYELKMKEEEKLVTVRTWTKVE